MRGGMDASQYKDYVLTMLFLKYISDKQKADPESMLYTIPEGCTFDDVVRLKNTSNVGDDLNKILAKVGAEFMNDDQFFRESDFNDSQKLGTGKNLVDTVSSLIGEFQRPGLDFGHNRAADDDLIGDAYEFLMRKFAQHSGKSKGQFYTPAEASRLAAELLGIRNDKRENISIYDMTCGSGSLLLRAANESNATTTSLHGQEIDISTLRMARLNMILHGKAGYDDLRDGDTINAPKHITPDNKLQTFDYCVANPPYSVKNWRKSASVNDEYGRWNEGVIGLPPDSKGDFAFLLHMIKSMKPTGKGSCFLPHGVLFRGTVEKGEGEAIVRKYLCDQHLISGIIGLPPNIFYGTGIPTCIVVIDKGAARDSKGIFMIDAKDGFVKDGDKNRLREQDIRRICDTWFEGTEIPHYSRLVSWEEIKANGYNLNIPRYVQPADTEAKQNLDAHLNGGIPESDINAMHSLWELCPSLRDDLFEPLREGFMKFTSIASEDIDTTIKNNSSYKAQEDVYESYISNWIEWMRQAQKEVCLGCQPKLLIQEWGRYILELFAGCNSLVDNYDVYDELCKYWDETMQDDAYMVSRDGWKVLPELPKDKKGNVKKSFSYGDISCDLLPSMVLINAYMPEQLNAIRQLETSIELKEAEMSAMVDQYEDIFIDDDGEILKDSVIKAIVKAAKKGASIYTEEELKIYTSYATFLEELDALKKEMKEASTKLTAAVQDKYKNITPEEISETVFTYKWMPAMRKRLGLLMKSAQQVVSTNLHSLNLRYEHTLLELPKEVINREKEVNEFLKAMGFSF